MENKIKGLIIIIIIIVGVIGISSAMLLQNNTPILNNSTNNTTNNNSTNGISNNTNNGKSTKAITSNNQSVTPTNTKITPSISASQAKQVVLNNGIPQDAMLSVSYDSTTGIYTITAHSNEYTDVNTNKPEYEGYDQVNGTNGALIAQQIGFTNQQVAD